MIAWLYNLIVGQFCGHKWKLLSKGKWEGDFGSYGTYYHLQCEKCGKIKGQKA